MFAFLFLQIPNACGAVLTTFYESALVDQLQMVNFGQMPKEGEAKFNSDVSFPEFDVPDANQAVSVSLNHHTPLKAVVSNVLVVFGLGKYLGCV